MVTTRRPLLLGLLPALAGCQPDFPNRSSIVDDVRVLAMQSSPAQAKPSAQVAYALLVAGPQGTIAAPSVEWSFCTLPKPPSQINDVNSDCFTQGDLDGGPLTSFGEGETAMGKLPANACKQFGPDVPQTAAGPGRPIDPDITGGYYQPVVLRVAGEQSSFFAVGQTRLTCGLANAGVDQLNLFLALAKTNENPVLSAVSALSLNDTPLTPEGAAAPLQVAANSQIVLKAAWSSCPEPSVCGDGICGPLEGLADDMTTGSKACPDDCKTAPRGCTGAETYASLDPLTHVVGVRHEEMRVSWFATAGAFDSDHTGNVEANYRLTSTTNGWKSPATPGPVFMWVVLHDSRGGLSWQSFQLAVR